MAIALMGLNARQTAVCKHRSVVLMAIAPMGLSVMVLFVSLVQSVGKMWIAPTGFGAWITPVLSSLNALSMVIALAPKFVFLGVVKLGLNVEGMPTALLDSRASIISVLRNQNVASIEIVPMARAASMASVSKDASTMGNVPMVLFA